MVKLTIYNNIRGCLEGKFDDKALDEQFAFRKSKFWFRSRAAKVGLWDGKTHMFHRDSGTLPMGLWPDVKKALKKQGIKKIKIIDQRTDKPIKYSRKRTKLKGIKSLRKDQRAAIVKAIKKERGIIHAATGSGKTEIAIGIIEKLGRPPTLFVTGRKKLARQTRERFAERLGLRVDQIGFIQGGVWEDGDSGIYIAVVNTLVAKKFARKRRKLYHTVRALFLDEAHHAGSTTWYRTTIYCRARYRFGLTGTPTGRHDGADLYLRACTGGVVARIRSKQLIDEGILAAPTVYFTSVRRPATVAVWSDGTSWSYIYKRGISKNKHRNKMIVDYARGLQKVDKQTLILVTKIDHGRRIEKQLDDACFLCHASGDDVIDEACKEFERGNLKTLIATSIFDEGIDIPSISALIVASGGKSIISTLQRIGRGLRRKEDDNRLFVFDFMDHTNEYLMEHSQRRLDVCKDEGFKVSVLNRPGSIPELIT